MLKPIEVNVRPYKTSVPDAGINAEDQIDSAIFNVIWYNCHQKSLFAAETLFGVYDVDSN